MNEELFFTDAFTQFLPFPPKHFGKRRNGREGGLGLEQGLSIGYE